MSCLPSIICNFRLPRKWQGQFSRSQSSFSGTSKPCLLFGLVICFTFHYFLWKLAIGSKLGHNSPFGKEKRDWDRRLMPQQSPSREQPLFPFVLYWSWWQARRGRKIKLSHMETCETCVLPQLLADWVSFYFHISVCHCLLWISLWYSILCQPPPEPRYLVNCDTGCSCENICGKVLAFLSVAESHPVKNKH